MDHIASVRAALSPKVTAPVIAIPVDGHAPICVRAKLLKGALKGVTIHSVEILENRWLKITGMAGYVHTCSKFAPMDRYQALRLISDWADRERKKRIKVINQGVLSASEQRAMKLKAAEQAGVAELRKAQREEQEILSEARHSLLPVMIPVDPEDRAEIEAEYKQFREHRSTRKRGSVIQWRLKKLREQVKAVTKEQFEYEDRPRISPFSRRRRVMIGKKTVLRRKKDAARYMVLTNQIGRLEAQFEELYPYVKHPRYEWTVSSFQEKRPNKLPYSVPWGWENHSDCDWDEDEENTAKVPRLKRMAEHLKNVRGDIRALTPPEDENTQEQIAA